MINHFQNQIVWITGASSGLGAALAKELHHRGARLAISGRNVSALEALKTELHSDDILILPFDVTNKLAHYDAVQKILAHFGGLDTAILNAGMSQFVELEHFADTFEIVMPINFMGVVYGIDALLKVFLPKRQGHIAVVSSLVALGGIPCVEAYCASKFALRGMLQGLDAHLSGTGIDLTTIYPGFIKTPLTAGNSFKMPFLLSPEKAARIIVQSLAKKQKVLYFPWIFSTVVRLFNLLPHNIYTKCMARFDNIKKAV